MLLWVTWNQSVSFLFSLTFLYFVDLRCKTGNFVSSISTISPSICARIMFFGEQRCWLCSAAGASRVSTCSLWSGMAPPDSKLRFLSRDLEFAQIAGNPGCQTSSPSSKMVYEMCARFIAVENLTQFSLCSRIRHQICVNQHHEKVIGITQMQGMLFF